MARRRRRLLIPGPVLVGFADVFDNAHGSARTPRPYPRVTPSRMGSVLLPFQCPHCGEVKSAVVDPKTRNGYRDAERNFSWCPSCHLRYVIIIQGMPLTESIPAGATHAPALVERSGRAEVVGKFADDGLDILGAC